MRKLCLAGLALAAASLIGNSAQAQINVGIVTSLSGPISSIGIPYGKGIAAGTAAIGEISGQKVNVFQLDDASDPSAAARAAHKLIEEDKVDIILGAAGAPPTLAVYGIAYEAKVPMIVIANILVEGERGDWQITVPQPASLMVAADVDNMKKAGIKTVAYIGYSDAWGDLVYDALMKTAPPAGIQVVTNERYARADTSVTAQVLKIVAAHPDAVLTGGSGTPGALPHIALADRGYHGPEYSTHAIINKEFVRVGAAAVDGVIAEQLPASNPIRKVALDFREIYQKVNNEPANDAFAAYAYDGWLIFADTAKRALATGAKPGTPEFRKALRDAMVTTKDVVGTHAVYTFKPGERYGVDERSRVMLKLEKGTWKLLP